MLGLLTLALIAGTAPDDPKLPPPSQVKVDFDAQIRPILQARCLNCHAKGKYKGGLSLETREATLKGGESGPAVVVGKSGESLLVELVAGLDPDRRMPDKGDPLTREQVGLIRAWVDQGLPWPEGTSFGFRKAALAPRNPAVPAAPGLENPIDRFIARHQANQGTSDDWSTVPDRVFARRASLDLVGLIPSPEQLADLLIKPEDGRFARTIVNRLWAQLMGRGIVEPLDDMDQAAWDQDPLDWLASDFVAHGHDLKHTLALIASSRAYRLKSRGVADASDRSSFVFRGPLTKRMTAEQFADAPPSAPRWRSTTP